MTSIWCIWIFQITLRWKAFILFFLPAKGTAMQWPYNCWVWMVGLGPVIGVLSWWRGPTCPFCICATCESGSCRYVDGTARWFQVSGMFCCLSRCLSCYSSSNAFFCSSDLSTKSGLSGGGVFLFWEWSWLANFQGPIQFYSVVWGEQRVLTWSFFVSAHLSRNSELLQICWANTDNQHFRPYLGCRESGPHHRR